MHMCQTIQKACHVSYCIEVRWQRFMHQNTVVWLVMKRRNTGLFYLIDWLGLESEDKKTRHVQKLAINRKSTFFVRSLWNLVKIITPWDNHFHKVSWGLDKNWGFFSNGQFLSVSGFFFTQTLVTVCKRKLVAVYYSRHLF